MSEHFLVYYAHLLWRMKRVSLVCLGLHICKAADSGDIVWYENIWLTTFAAGCCWLPLMWCVCRFSVCVTQSDGGSHTLLGLQSPDNRPDANTHIARFPHLEHTTPSHLPLFPVVLPFCLTSQHSVSVSPDCMHWLNTQIINIMCVERDFSFWCLLNCCCFLCSNFLDARAQSRPYHVE